MTPHAEILHLLAKTPDAVRGHCIALLFEDHALATGSADLLGHPNVETFIALVRALAPTSPGAEQKLKDDVRQKWPAFFPSQLAVVTDSEEPGSAAPESPLVAKAYDYLESGFLPELMALKLAALVISVEQGSDEVRTGEVARLLRAAGYRLSNPAALVRSLADRAQPAIEILEERVGPRQELQFRLLEETVLELKKGLLKSKASAA